MFVRSDWGDDFTTVIIDRPVGDAKKDDNYIDAKSGDPIKALALAKNLIQDATIDKLKAIVELHENDDISIVPVHADEETGYNMIPLACAVYIESKLNLINVTVDKNIVQSLRVGRTNKDGWYRLANPPGFSGKVKKNSKIIIIDDNITQGGTFVVLKAHIEKQGGIVIGAYALTGKQFSSKLKISEETLCDLRKDYEQLEKWWEKEFKYNFSHFTESEGKYIINSKKSDEFIRNTILKNKQS